MQLGRALVFLCLLISAGAQMDHRVTCYLDILTRHTHGGLCTHIVVPSVSAEDNLSLQNMSETDYDILCKMKDRNPTLKILLGLEFKPSRLELLSVNQPSFENFIEVALRYLRENNLDGLDVSWLDSPTSDESSKSKELFTVFLKSLRGGVEEEARLSGNQTLLLSVSVPDHTDHSSAVSYDEQTFSQYVDFVSLLPTQLVKDGLDISGTVQHWQDQQVDLQKLNLALPAFLQRSRSRRRHHHRDHHSHDDQNTEKTKEVHIHGLGLMLANQVCQTIKSEQKQFIAVTSLSDEQSHASEVSWLLQKGFGGVGVVFIDFDVFSNSVCADSTQDERAIVESKVVMPSHHGRRPHGHRRDHHHNHRDHHHSTHLHHDSGDISHHHHGHHHRGHGHHGHHHHGHHRRHHHHHHHHHHHPQPTTSSPQRNLE